MPNARGRIRVPGKMNNTEARYAALLDQRKSAGEILWWAYEGISFRLADLRCHYHPDFSVMLPDGTMEIHETKGGFAREDSLIKLKVAASLYPFVFRKCTWKGGKWEIVEVGESAKREPPKLVKPLKPTTSERMALVNGKPVPYADALALIEKKTA